MQRRFKAKLAHDKVVITNPEIFTGQRRQRTFKLFKRTKGDLNTGHLDAICKYLSCANFALRRVVCMRERLGRVVRRVFHK